ncbi:GlcG/HbpS family heme-binding protein [Pararhizobium haloflavum]|uniref:GlcG/HbpS family heme-binding protein n=1 Tax=Pararhizobium haloflavum TaxID=2037914 RepID=UPI000C18A407|nr:heme-binding protein [Pararhizobium haloflavum]
MADISLSKANRIISGCLAKAREMSWKPLGVVVLDSAGHIKASQRQDGASMLRIEMGAGKAYGALAIGSGSRWLHNQAETRPHFLTGMVGVSDNRILPVPGGVLVLDKRGTIIGAVGISGDTADNDEAAAIAGIEHAGLTAQAD